MLALAPRAVVPWAAPHTGVREHPAFGVGVVLQQRDCCDHQRGVLDGGYRIVACDGGSVDRGQQHRVRPAGGGLGVAHSGGQLGDVEVFAGKGSDLHRGAVGAQQHRVHFTPGDAGVHDPLRQVRNGDRDAGGDDLAVGAQQRRVELAGRHLRVRQSGRPVPGSEFTFSMTGASLSAAVKVSKTVAVRVCPPPGDRKPNSPCRWAPESAAVMVKVSVPV
jgi:hypothetical protein